MSYEDLLQMWWMFYAGCAGVGGFCLGVLVTAILLTWKDKPNGHKH